MHSLGSHADLANLPRVAFVRILCIILQRLWASELMVARGSGADVALAGDLAGETCHGAGYCAQSSVTWIGLAATRKRNGWKVLSIHFPRTLVDLAEDGDTREPSLRIPRDCGVENIDAWSRSQFVCAIARHIALKFR